MGPGERHGARPRRVEAPGRHVGRHDPRPRAVRRVPPRRQAGRRARRGDGLREPSGRDVRARRVDVADRGHHVRAGHRHAGAGPARQDAVLARRPAGPAAGARPGPRGVRARAARGDAEAATRAPLRDEHALDELAASNLLQYLDRAGRGHRRRARRPHDRHRAVPRRDRRLAGVRAQPVRHAGPRTVGDGHRAPTGRPLRHAGRVDVGRRRHRPASARRRPTKCRSTRSRSIPRTSRSSSCRRCRRPPCSRRGSGSAPADRCCCHAAGPISARRCGSSASGPPTCSPSPPSTRRSPCCWRRRGSACRTSSTSRRCARCSASCGRERCGSSASRRRSRRRWRRACCSTGSPPTCTRATRRSPSAGPRRWRSTATCSPTCSASRSCASCSIPGVLADVELDLQHLSDGRRARTADELHDVLRRVGDLTDRGRAAVRARRRDDVPGAGCWRRSSPSGGRSRWRWPASSGSPPPRTPPATATASAAPLPLGLPQVFTEPVPRPLEDLVARYARTHGPFVERDVAVRFGLPESRAAGALAALESEGRIVRGEFRPDGVRREWCDVDVLRQLRRRSLAVLRREVEPVEQEVLAEFLPAWQGVGNDAAGCRAARRGARRAGRGAARGVDARARRARGADRRVPAVDARRAVHVGRGGVDRRRCGRVQRRARPAVLRRPGRAAGAELGARRSARTARCTTRCATRSPPAGRASGRSCAPASSARPTTSCSRRCGTSCGRARSPTTRWPRCGRCTGGRRGAATGGSVGRGRPRPAVPARPHRPGHRRRAMEPGGPAARATPTPTASAHAAAMQLVERHGVVTREAVLAEGVVGGFASVYGVLKVLEERGQVRRGYFVSGLGAAQFAVPGAVDRLRSLRRADDPMLAPNRATSTLGRADRALGHRSGPAVRRTLAWPDSPGRPARIGAAFVVMREGVPLVWHDRRSHHLVTFPRRRRPRVGDALAPVGTGGSARSRSARSTGRP